VTTPSKQPTEAELAERLQGLPPPAPRVPFTPYDPGEAPEKAAQRFYEIMKQRRTVRDFSDRPVSLATMEWIIRAAGTSPSGAHKQPWRFVCVRDAATKRKIREAAEAEEREFYARRASRRWLEDLAPLGTDSSKPFLEIAPWIVVVFQLAKTDTGGLVYYRQESVGIAVGLLLAAAHHAGLVTLTHTPSPMGFLQKALNRPPHERAFVVIPVGYPAEQCTAPDLQRKPLEEIMVVPDEA